MVPQERKVASGLWLHAEREPRPSPLQWAAGAAPTVASPTADHHRRGFRPSLPPQRVRPEGGAPRPQGQQRLAGWKLQQQTRWFRSSSSHRQRPNLLRLRRNRRSARHHRIHCSWVLPHGEGDPRIRRLRIRRRNSGSCLRKAASQRYRHV